MSMDYIITSNCDKAIKLYLNAKFTTSSDKEYQQLFATLPHNIQRELMYNILKTQANVIKESIKTCNTITLVGFGTFEYREGKRRADVFRDKLAMDFGYPSFSDVEDNKIRDIIISKVNDIKRNVLLPEQIKKVKEGKLYKVAKAYTSFSNVIKKS